MSLRTRTTTAIAACGIAALAAGCASGGATATHGTASTMKTQSATDDQTITARVKTALLNDTQINATRIDVSTAGGVVTMTGTVKSQGEIDRAVQLARGVEGVRDVKPNLQVGG